MHPAGALECFLVLGLSLQQLRAISPLAPQGSATAAVYLIC